MTVAKAEEIFDRARTIPAGTEREEFVRSAAAGHAELVRQVEALLEALEAAQQAEFLGFDENTSYLLRSAAPDLPASEQAGKEIGYYKLLQQIGEGGFGTVWMAEQKEPIKRRVALKIIKLGMDTKQVIARFEAERQALAMMDHPNIAKVFDAGATDAGRPYFVMELIRGIPILEYCDAERLSTRQRLELFIQVCNAIQHAHQKGIIHRDVKPSNVLVTLHGDQPIVRVIDFGIAKATNTELTQKTFFTEHRQMIGTPAYMSPEQAAMSGLDIDTRSDVYSLGVLLYELLTGTTPFDQKDLLSKGFAEMMRIIREVEPHKPSTRLSSLGETGTRTAELRRAEVKRLGSILKGDLDWIVMRCLEKDRARRYETANGLATDIQRHLSGEPVVAAPPSRVYRMKKFVRRNRGAAIACGTVALLLVIGIAGTSWGLHHARMAAHAESEQREVAEINERRAIEEAERAEREARRAMAAEAEIKQRAEEFEKIATFQAAQLRDINAEIMGVGMRRIILESKRSFLKTSYTADEEVESSLAELESALIGVNFTTVALGVLDESIFDRSLRVISQEFDDQPSIKAGLLQTVADVLRRLGMLDRAIAPQVEALDIRREIYGSDHPKTIASLSMLGDLLTAKGHLADAEEALREALERSRRVNGEDHPTTILVMGNLGSMLQSFDRHHEAEGVLQEALRRSLEVLGDDHSTTLSVTSNLGSVLFRQGKLEEAEMHLRRVLDVHRLTVGEDHPYTLKATSNLGVVLAHRGRQSDAERYYRMALEGSRRLLGDSHPDTLISIVNTSSLLYDMRQFEEAERLAAEGVATARCVLPANHANMGAYLHIHALSLMELSRFAEAEERMLEAQSIFEASLPPSHWYRVRSIEQLIGFYDRWHRAEPEAGYDKEAERWRAMGSAGSEAADRD